MGGLVTMGSCFSSSCRLLYSVIRVGGALSSKAVISCFRALPRVVFGSCSVKVCSFCFRLSGSIVSRACWFGWSIGVVVVVVGVGVVVGFVVVVVVGVGVVVGFVVVVVVVVGVVVGVGAGLGNIFLMWFEGGVGCAFCNISAAFFVSCFIEARPILYFMALMWRVGCLSFGFTW